MRYQTYLRYSKAKMRILKYLSEKVLSPYQKYFANLKSCLREI